MLAISSVSDVVGTPLITQTRHSRYYRFSEPRRVAYPACAGRRPIPQILRRWNCVSYRCGFGHVLDSGRSATHIRLKGTKVVYILFPVFTY